MRDYPVFLVTIDTEADDSWSRPDRIELKNLSEISRFQELCERYDIMPTYLVTYECATRDEAISILKPFSDSSRCEIGHHLHCWTTPPFQKKGTVEVDLAWLHAYQSELPDSLFSEKAEALSCAIEKAYGKRPTSHRAGRWGIDQRSIEWLINNGFVVDSSVVPLKSYSTVIGKTSGGPTFYSSPRGVYLCQQKPTYKNDKASLMVIPVSIDIPEKIVAKVCARYLYLELPGSRMADRLFRRVGGGSMLRPDPSLHVRDLSRIIDRLIKANLPVINLFLHSSELALGCSPFSKTQEDYDHIWKSLDEVFNRIRQFKLTSITLSKAATVLKESIVHNKIRTL